MSIINTTPKHRDQDNCPACNHKTGGKLILRVSKFRSGNGSILFYLTCSSCKYTTTSWLTKENDFPLKERNKIAKALWLQAKRTNVPV